MGVTIPDMLNKFTTLLNSIENEVSVIINGDPQDAIKLNQKQLFEKSIDSDGNKLKEYRSSSYAARKNTINPLPGFGRPDLYVTGKFYKGFYAEVKGRRLTIGSNDAKSGGLEKKYGKKIFGLTHDNIEIYRSTKVFPKLRSFVNRITGL